MQAYTNQQTLQMAQQQAAQHAAAQHAAATQQAAGGLSMDRAAGLLLGTGGMGQQPPIGLPPSPQTQPLPSPQQAPPPPAAAAPPPPGTVRLDIEVPEGANVGDRLTFNTAAGQFSLVVPSGAAPGKKMMVTMPVPANFASNQQLTISELRIMPCRRLTARLRQLPHDVLANLAARLGSESPAPHTSTCLPTLRRAAKSMPSDRLSLRMSVLAELAAQLCSESPALRATAEECMAANNPLPHDMVERVLLSPDLVPHILGPLEAEDGAAAAVCSQWLVGWKATNEAPWRRRLKQVRFELPEEMEIDTNRGLEMAATPDGRLVVRQHGPPRGRQSHILDRSMRVLQTITNNGDFMTAIHDSIFECTQSPITEYAKLRRSTHDGTAVAEYGLEGHGISCHVFAPGGLLFCAIFDHEDRGDPVHDEIIALDAQTLQLRHRFGRGLLNDANQLAVGGDELYVCDTGNHRLQVFSLTGDHRRSITGEWRSPEVLRFANDRLYLVERVPTQEEDGDTTEDTNPLQGRRILVLSLQGDILQVVTYPLEPTAVFKTEPMATLTSLCCFEHKLLVSYGCNSVSLHGVFALQGL